MVKTKSVHLFGVHDGGDADGERLPRHLADVVAEEALVGLERVVRERLDARARRQRRARLVERDVPVRTNTCHKLQIHYVTPRVLCFLRALLNGILIIP